MENQTFQYLASADHINIQVGRTEHHYEYIGYSHSLTNPLWRDDVNFSSPNNKRQP